MGSVRTNLLRKENPSQGGDSTFTASPADSFPLLVLEGAAGGKRGHLERRKTRAHKRDINSLLVIQF